MSDLMTFHTFSYIFYNNSYEFVLTKGSTPLVRVMIRVLLLPTALVYSPCTTLSQLGRFEYTLLEPIALPWAAALDN